MSNRNIIYSGHPLAVANLQLDAEEFQHVVYMPVKTKNAAECRLPDNLEWTRPALHAVMRHLWGPRCPDLFESWYVYLSVKRSWVEAGTAGNREGWHIDGYGSNGDKNFIWCDSVPAEYMEGTFSLPEDHAGCLERLEYLGTKMDQYFITEGELATHTLYDLGSTIHRCGIAKVSGMRTFVKISVSRDKYDLKGNARNPLLPSTHWPLKDRQGTRNHPTAQPGNGRAEAYRPTIGQPLLDHVDTLMHPWPAGRVAPIQESRCPTHPVPSLKSWGERLGNPEEFCRCRNNLECITTQCGQEYEIATHGIHKGTQIAQTGTEQLHNEGSLS